MYQLYLSLAASDSVGMSYSDIAFRDLI